MLNDKTRYLLKNLLNGLIWLGIIVILFLIAKEKVHLSSNPYLVKVFSNSYLVYATFLVSEIAFGLIPPELFFIWALQFNHPTTYFLIIVSLSAISYFAGITGYLFGSYLTSTRFFRFIRLKYLKKYNKRLHKYGIYLIAVAALTPLPFSGICMLVGSVKYPMNRFLLVASLRYARFIVYGWIIWKANTF